MAEALPIQCQIETSEISGPLGKTKNELTVGHKFLLNCEGEWPELNKEKLELRLEATDQYKLKLLDFEKESTLKAKLLVTSYKPGEHQLKAVQLVDNEHSVLLGDLRFTVKSVINPAEPPSEAFGPMGPLVLRLPWWSWLTLFLLFVLIGSYIWIRIRRRLQRKKLLEEMALHSSALSPIAEFSQKLRALQRNLTDKNLSEINSAFRVYFARKFQIPTLVWSDRLILKDFYKTDPKTYAEHGPLVTKTFFELSRAEKNQVNLQDLEQLIGLVRKCAENLETKGDK